MHKNSLEAYRKITEEGSKNTREKDILTIYSNYNRPLTDYEILQNFKPGSDNLNLVRPRITELHQKGILEEGPPIKSHMGRLNVRTSKIKDFEEQLQTSLF